MQKGEEVATMVGAGKAEMKEDMMIAFSLQRRDPGSHRLKVF